MAEGMEAVLKMLIEDWQKREEEITTQHAVEESRRYEEREAQVRREGEWREE